jgi:hypothetical protein
MMKNVLLASLAVVALMAATPAVALQAEMARYQQVIDSREICNTGITQEHVQLYQVAVAALDAANYGAGRQPSLASSGTPIDAAQSSAAGTSTTNVESNFYGPIAPELALANCGGGGGE